MNIDTHHFKDKLEEEKKKLEGELESVAPKNSDTVAEADENIQAEIIEEFEDGLAITSSLEARYKDVVDALEKIKRETFGLCEVCGAPIEAERLEANPAARTCKEHINSL